MKQIIQICSLVSQSRSLKTVANVFDCWQSFSLYMFICLVVRNMSSPTTMTFATFLKTCLIAWLTLCLKIFGCWRIIFLLSLTWLFFTAFSNLISIANNCPFSKHVFRFHHLLLSPRFYSRRISGKDQLRTVRLIIQRKYIVKQVIFSCVCGKSGK